MECLTTWACCGCFAKVYSAIGVRRFDGAVSAIASPGSGYTPSQPNGCRPPTSCIRILRNACALRPKARARCGSAARRDLCGGCWVTGIPTATYTGEGAVCPCVYPDAPGRKKENNMPRHTVWLMVMLTLALLAAPHATKAQQPVPPYRIGYLGSGAGSTLP